MPGRVSLPVSIYGRHVSAKGERKERKSVIKCEKLFPTHAQGTSLSC